MIDTFPTRIVRSDRARVWRYALPILIGVGAIAIAVAPALYCVAAILGMAALLFFLSHPYAGMCALTFCVPFESVYNLHAGGFNLTITNCVVFCVTAAWLVRGISTGDFSPGAVPWRPALLVYGFVLIISVTQSIDYAGSAKELIKWGQLVFIYVVACSMLRTRKDIRLLLTVMFVAVLAESAVGIAQVGLHSGPSSFARGAVLRGSGTFDQPNPFAGYLNTVLPLAICCLIFRVLPRRWMWLVVAVTAAGILGSLSRGGELGSVAALLTIGLARTKIVKAFLLVAVATGALVAAGLVVGLLPGSLTDPIAQGLGIANVDVVNPNSVDWSTAERLAHMEAGLHMFADHPYLGVGIGNYPAQYPNYQVAPVWGPNLGHAHNYYINIAAEAGVIGFAAYILLFGSAMAICLRTYRRSTEPFGKTLGLGGLAVLIAFSSHQFFDDLLVHGIEVQLALIMAMVTRCGLTTPEEPTTEPSRDLVSAEARR